MRVKPHPAAALLAWLAGVSGAGSVIAESPVAADAPPAAIAPNHASIAPYLEVWYRADALRLDSGERVHVWPDQSGHGRDLAATRGVRAGGVGTAPQFAAASDVNRRPAVRFEPTDGLAASPDNRIDIHGDAAFSIVIVMNLRRNETAPPYDAVFGFGDPASARDPGRPLAALVELDRTHDHQLDLAGGFSHDASLGPGSFQSLYGQAVILTIVKAPGPLKSTTRFFLNSERSGSPPLARQVTGPDTAPDIQHRADIGVFIGKALAWCGGLRGDVAEVIVYKTALADAARSGIETHLAEKYAVSLSRDFRATRVAFTAEQKSHWAFQPLRDFPAPPVTAETSVQSPIDRFVLAKLDAAGIRPAARADKRTLIRRATFDLTGLPPTPQEIEMFLKDDSPDAMAKLVNRLLESKHYGERWGRHWLDVVRYAESTANDANAVMRYAYRYRDYVIDAFNRDLPYDQFLVEQLAGDLLPPTADLGEAARRVIATGFLMVGPKALAETDKEQSRLDIVDDQIDVIGRSMLGLTLGCARCHDHKFDPVPTVDYYALAGILRSTEPFMDEVRNATMWWEFPLLEVPGEKPVVVMAPKEAAPRNLRVHLRGNRFTLGPTVPRGFLQVLAPAESGGSNDLAAGPLRTTQSGRLELARWIVGRDRGAAALAARVMVNRIWQHHFGAGLVATSDNFGRRGEPPSHPDLLEHMASRFIESGWSVKAMHRLMMLSSTYQQRSGNDAATRTDPDNRLLARMPRRRLAAEELRDAMLVASGQLDRKVGGGETAEVMYQKAEVLDAKRGFAPNRLQSTDPIYNTPRRTVYLPVVRNALPDMLAIFDAADPNGVTAARNDTTVPAQALLMMNNSFVRDQAGHMARALVGDEKLNDDDRIRLAYELAVARPPSGEELADAREFLAAYRAAPSVQTRPEPQRPATAWQSLCHALLCSNEFLYVE
jgi:hypothetical protein